MFTSVLVANRGEIAVRICHTLRAMGIRSVVVASIPDRHSLAVRSADDWVLLEGYSAAESYLDIDAVVAAARAKGCEAIHPGYGFLSERTDFAERCAAEGIVFIGPPPAVLAGMGDKAAARRLAVANGVPVVPGWDGADDDDTLAREAARIGFPLMVKARGGGGGRGMREVMAADALPEALASARAEALAAFGDGGLLLEKLVQRAHHVEVQVLADAHGNFVHLGERDCSVQRRHQKLIEETPSPIVDESLRAELTGAALKLARAIGYVNAGTFEFLVGEAALTPGPSPVRGPGESGRPFYFLEVNPRLQVEHPVTEMVTGLDLVELQVRIAAGEPLPFAQDDVRFNGHAIECRINAEDPWDGFKPSSGRIDETFWHSFDSGDRFDVGYEAGDVVPTQYDSLLAKVIVHRDDRTGALDRARQNLTVSPRGVATNTDFLLQIAASGDFRAGSATIDWLDVTMASLHPTPRPADEWWAAAAIAMWHGRTDDSPATARDNVRAFDSQPRWVNGGESTVWLRHGDFRARVSGVVTADGARRVTVEGRPVADARATQDTGGAMSIDIGDGGGLAFGASWPLSWKPAGPVSVRQGDAQVSFSVIPPPPLPRRPRAATEGATAITAPLAGTVASVRVAEGDAVEVGQLLVTLDAMKMEHRVLATSAGKVKRLPVKAGDVVREGDLLVEVA